MRLEIKSLYQDKYFIYMYMYQMTTYVKITQKFFQIEMSLHFLNIIKL